MKNSSAEVEFSGLTADHIPRLLELWKHADLEIKPAGRDHPDALRHEMESPPPEEVRTSRADCMEMKMVPGKEYCRQIQQAPTAELSTEPLTE